MKIARIAMATVTAATMLIGAAGTAVAEETTCRGRIGSRTVDNLRVPSGATCTLEGTLVKGTIKVARDATLYASDVRVIGNVQGENARRVNVTAGSRVGGSIQVVQGRAGVIRNTKVNADILFDDQSGEVRVERNVVGGNIQAFQNTGGVRIADNTVDGNLQCKENNPRPTGGNNRVEGNKEDQCRNL